MPVTSPMAHTGATTKPLPTITVQPGREMTPETLQSLPSLAGMNAMFVVDVLSDMAMHERCGFHLYRSLAGRTNNPVLQRKYVEFGEETHEHIAVLEQLLTELGADPQYVSPSARATEKMDTSILESTFLLEGSVDIMTQELVMLDAVLLAETRDHANWSGLRDLVPMFPEGPARDAVQRAVDQVEDQEDEHLEWAKRTRKKLIAMQAKSTVMTTVAATAEDLMARVKGLFDGSPAA
ncbi:MAG TPA: ferritin-like domain-containing protein [Aquihabitans sp.]|jgi:rubrerythrin|nr:ferritin-like domain-containing protein [Aquihabitans sp.]